MSLILMVPGMRGCTVSYTHLSAFKKHHNMPPYKFRRSIVHKSMMNPVFRNTQTELLTWQECSEKITVEMFEDCTVTVSYTHLDVYKRQLQGLCFLIWFISHTFLMFALGFVFWAVAGAFTSGTEEGLIYDNLKCDGRENSFARCV